MRVFLKDEARHDIKKMTRAQRLLFNKHFDKIADDPIGEHMRHGLPFFKEYVGQGRAGSFTRWSATRYIL